MFNIDLQKLQESDEDLTKKAPIPEFRSQPYDRKVQVLRSALEEVNYLLHQVEEDTGLTLAHFQIESDGFRCMDDIYENPIELFEDAPWIGPRYKHFEYNASEAEMQCNQVWSVMRRLEQFYIARHNLLGDYERVWNHTDQLDPTIYVHFGLHYVIVAIPLLTLAKYHIVYADNVFRFIDISIVHFHNYDGICFKIPWSETYLQALDNLAYLLSWKIEEYRKYHQDRYNFVQFRNQRERFRMWEQKYLAI